MVRTFYLHYQQGKFLIRIRFRCTEQLTNRMYGCFLSCREFLGQGWMKVDKTERTPYIMKTSQHFNDVRTKLLLL